MATTARGGGTPGSRPIGVLGTSLACVLLTLFFLFLGFPYDRLGERLAAELSRGNGTQLSFQELGPFISLAGPGFEATGARITTADGIRLQLDRARLRPAWSLAWLRLAPAIHLDLEGPPGHIIGVVTLGQTPGFEGRLEAIDLAQLPKNLVASGTVLAGTLDAVVDLRAGSPGPQGSISLSAREGSLGAPDLLPMAVPFDELSASLRLGDGALLEVESFETQSPLFSAQVSGTIATAPSFVDAPLNLQVKLQTDPAFRNTLQGLGIRVSRDGKATLRIRGTLTAPVLR
ncbi:MAG: type II secretion system protein GspN [Deltaproteobacteria bacterium]|nr:type II secretion system protein GspN [Deltaproteobacteria bacterium]